MKQVFSSTTVEADVAAKLLESFQDAEQLLRSGGSATATEVTEAAAVTRRMAPRWSCTPVDRDKPFRSRAAWVAAAATRAPVVPGGFAGG